MKLYQKLTVFFALTAFILISNESFSQQIRVACIGNSLTFGTGIKKRELNSYPAQLQRLLGDAYLVRNFGYEGSEIMESSDKAYTKSQEYQESIDFKPEVIIMSFGMEEGKDLMGELSPEFIENYKNLAFKYFNLPTALRVIILTPTPSFDTYGSLKDETVVNTLIPAVENVAYDTNSEIIDLYSVLSDGGDYFNDGINISALGANRIARNIYESIAYISEHDFDFVYEMGIKNERSNFHGYSKSTFDLYGWTTELISPRRTAIGRPWVLRAGGTDTNISADLGLLQRGYHIAYIDTEGLFGNADAVDRLGRLYELMQTGSMAEHPLIEAYGQYAIEAFNWATINQDKVSGIFLQDPLLDLKSWPLGEGKAERDDDAVAQMMRAYGIRNEKKMGAFEVSPVNYLDGWSNNVIPFLIYHSQENKQIPFEENSKKLMDVENIGNKTTLINAWNDTGRTDATEVISFMLFQTEKSVNFAEIPSAGTEFGTVKGWVAGSDWWDHHREITRLMKARQPEIIFMGDQFIQELGGDRSNITSDKAERIFNASFGEKWINAGIAGDRTEQMIYRIMDGNYKQANARVLVYVFSVDNFNDVGGENIAIAIDRLIKVSERYMPDVKIILAGPIPTGVLPNFRERIIHDDVHKRLQHFNWGDFVYYYPISTEFLTREGRLNTALYDEDVYTLSEAGYEKLIEILQPKIQEVLDVR